MDILKAALVLNGIQTTEEQNDATQTCATTTERTVIDDSGLQSRQGQVDKEGDLSPEDDTKVNTVDHSEEPAAKRVRLYGHSSEVSKTSLVSTGERNVASMTTYDNAIHLNETMIGESVEDGQKTRRIGTGSPLLQNLLQSRLLDNNHMMMEGPCCHKYCMFSWEVNPWPV